MDNMIQLPVQEKRSIRSFESAQGRSHVALTAHSLSSVTQRFCSLRERSVLEFRAGRMTKNGERKLFRDKKIKETYMKGREAGRQEGRVIRRLSISPDRTPMARIQESWNPPKSRPPQTAMST